MTTPLERLRNRSAHLARPLTATLELTYVCNWRCVFCYNPRHSDLHRLTSSEWIEVLDDLRTLGTLTVTLTGGEALTHPEFMAIARAARERGIAVRIFTNGTLITEELAGEIAALFPVAVEMSLHGADAETHDRATAKPGSFVALLTAVEHLRRHGVRMLLKSLLTNMNEHQMDEIAALATSLGAEHQFDSAITARDDGNTEPLLFRSSSVAVTQLAELRRLGGTMPPVDRTTLDANCGLGRVTLAIDPEGNVYPCMQWRHRPLGNVRQTPLRDLWPGSAARQEAAAIATQANAMLRELGGEISEANFCPAHAVEQSGDPLALYPEFLQRVEIARQRRTSQGKITAAS